MAQHDSGKSRKLLGKLTSYFNTTSKNQTRKSNHSFADSQDSNDNIELGIPSTPNSKNNLLNDDISEEKKSSNKNSGKTLFSKPLENSNLYSKVKQFTDSASDVALGVVVNSKSSSKMSSTASNNKKNSNNTNNNNAIQNRNDNNFMESASIKEENVRLIGFGFDSTITSEKVKNKRDLDDNKRIISYIFGGMNRVLLLKQFFAFLKHNKIKMVIVSSNKEKYIRKCLQCGDILQYFDEIYDKTQLIENNGYETNIMEFIINVKYQIEDNWVNFDDLDDNNDDNDNEDNDTDHENEKEKEKEKESNESKTKSNETKTDMTEWKTLFVDSDNQVISRFKEVPVCNIYHIKTANGDENGLQLQHMQHIAKKMGLHFDTREKWYL